MPKVDPTQATPGPWKAVPKNKPWAITDELGNVIATCKEEYAHLLAASWDILKALQELKDELDYYEEEFAEEIVTAGVRSRVKSAIAKAKGEAGE